VLLPAAAAALRAAPATHQARGPRHCHQQQPLLQPLPLLLPLSSARAWQQAGACPQGCCPWPGRLGGLPWDAVSELHQPPPAAAGGDGGGAVAAAVPGALLQHQGVRCCRRSAAMWLQPWQVWSPLLHMNNQQTQHQGGWHTHQVCWMQQQESRAGLVTKPRGAGILTCGQLHSSCCRGNAPH
jgi:hypothetical protein